MVTDSPCELGTWPHFLTVFAQGGGVGGGMEGQSVGGMGGIDHSHVVNGPFFKQGVND